jgi:hypothetical protein
MNSFISRFGLGVDMLSQKNAMLNRRKTGPEQSILWSKLSLAQKFSASSLGKFGYELSFIRNDEGHSLAILMSDSGIAMITEHGDINISPKIKMR